MKDLFLDRNIVPVDIEDTMKQSYLDYSMSVIVGRAIPDARDGLKPVHRRILFAMKELNLDYNKPYKKSARVVGDVIGKYHPHGDMAVYDALVRMSQDFSMRYPLVDGQGNFGSIDGDAPAAMRYTEVRLTKIAHEMLKDLDKNSVDFVPNYDDTLQEPVVLPSMLPNLLMNGSSGIAVGFATNIPPHNLREVIDASLEFLERDGDITVEEIMDYIKGPDFPTGAICFDRASILQAYRSGMGKVKVRAKVREEKIKNRNALVVYELPYQVNKALLLQSIAQLVKDKKIDGIVDLRDESNKEGIRVVIELRRDEEPQVILNNLFKHTNLEVTFGINMLALVDNVPKLLNIKEAIEVFINHRIEVVKRRTGFLLKKARERAHILEGLRVTLDNIDEVVSIIRSSKDQQEARRRLKERFQLSDRQTQAILDMKLARLVALEKEKIIEEYKQLIKDISYYEGVLSNRDMLKQVIKEELEYIRDTYGDERRTEILDESQQIDIEDMIKNEKLLIIFSRKGYIKSVPIDVYSTQNRGGKGRFTASFADGDYIHDIFVTDSLNTLLCFANTGKVYRLKAYSVPKLSPSARGKPIVNLIRLQSGEQIKTILPLENNSSLFFVTRKGVVKKSSSKHFENINAGGKIAIKLADQDSLVRVFGVEDGDDVVITTKNGMIIRFAASDVRDMGRQAAGVRGIRLVGEDQVVSADRFNSDIHTKLIFVTARGMGKLILIDNVRKIKRGGKGVIGIKLNSGDYVVGSLALNDEDDVIVITRKGKIIKLESSTIRVVGRSAKGVKLIDIAPDDEVVSVAIARGEGESEA